MLSWLLDLRLQKGQWFEATTTEGNNHYSITLFFDSLSCTFRDASAFSRFLSLTFWARKQRLQQLKKCFVYRGEMWVGTFLVHNDNKTVCVSTLLPLSKPSLSLLTMEFRTLQPFQVIRSKLDGWGWNKAGRFGEV